VTAIADTGLLVALLNRRDLHHEWADHHVRAQLIRGPYVTCEAVLVETTHIVTSRSWMRSADVFNFVRAGAVDLAFRLDEHSLRISELLHTYRDRPIDLADACLIRMSEIYPNSTVVTTDSDFGV
jgi:predicted nucleic acid-binding protein